MEPNERPATETPAKEVLPAELNAGLEMPTPSERAIAAVTEDEKQIEPVESKPGEPKPGDTDSINRRFNPDSFLPRKDKLGRWLSKNVGRPPKGGRVEKPVAPAPKPFPSVVGGLDETGSPAPTAPSAQIGDRYDLAAEMYTRASYSMLDGIFNANGEWLPENDGEHIALRGAVATYLRYKQSEDLPPGLALALAVATYGAKRVSKPNTATRIRIWFVWLRARLATWRNGKRSSLLPYAPIEESERAPLPPQNGLPGNSSNAVDPMRRN